MKRNLTLQNNRISAVLGGFRLEFSAYDGKWLSLRDRSGNRILDGDNGLPAVTLTVGGVSMTSTGTDHLSHIRDTLPIGAGFKLKRYYMDAGPDERLNLILEDCGWSVNLSYVYNAEHNRLEIDADIIWNGEGEQLMRWAELRMPPLAHENDTVLEMPGYGNFLHLNAAGMPVGRHPLVTDRPGKEACCWQVGLMAAQMPDNLLISWLYGADMPVFWQLYKGHKGVWFEQKWICGSRMRKGDSVTVGTQYIRLGSGGELRDELMFMHDFWDESNIKLPEGRQTPEWARKAFIYETHVGEKRFHRSGRVHNPHPAIRDLINDLPRIAALGYTVIELMPRFPFPNYSVEDYFDIETCYGPKDDLAELVNRVHELGMKIFFDVVMHGVSDKSVHNMAKYRRHPLLDKHPEYFMYTEDGRVAKSYTWSFDQASEQYRAYVTEAFCYYVREFDADGFRVDAITWNFYPNWMPGLPYPGYKSIYGCFELFQKVREAVWAIKPGITFYSESTGPLMANSYDISYCYDEVWMYECLLPPLDKELMLLRGHTNIHGVKVDARGAAEWLDLRQKVMPKNWIKVHHADSHDSHEWAWVGIFQREYIGLAQSIALFAYCLFAEGGVMSFAQAEEGSEDVYAELIAMRKSYPALMEGSCDYVAINSEDRNLFIPLRHTSAQTLIPIINFSPDTADSVIDATAAVDGDGKYRFTEHFSKELREYVVLQNPSGNDEQNPSSNGEQNPSGNGEQNPSVDGHPSDCADLICGSRLCVPVRLPPYGYQLWIVEKISGC